jgi:DNA-directed RNA polymerase subunit M/transcription elongation factor TFIIS
MSFCPICNSILDISKSAIKKAYNPDNTPSDTDDNDDKIEKIISKLSKGETIDNLENIKIEQITSHELFSKLDKQKKASIISKLESMFKPQDDSTSAFYVCKTI